MKTLKIDVYSDLHLDSWINQGWKPEQIRVKPTKGVDLCLFAGDGGNGPEWYARAMRLLRGKYIKVIGVPGNHDYYGNKQYEGMLDLTLSDCSNQLYDVNGFKIVTSTLWSNFRHRESSMALAERGITDFRAIDGMTGPLMADLCHQAHIYLAHHAGSVDVVMTHFAPLAASEHPAYESCSHLNPYFINDEPEFVETMGAKLWVHGHTHKKFDYTFKGTKVVANPIGYSGEEQEEPVFLPKYVEISKDE